MSFDVVTRVTMIAAVVESKQRGNLRDQAGRRS